MSSTTLASAPGTTLWRRAAPVLCGGALAVSAVVVATNDPAAAGSRFPACQFHTVTGLWCPGCGLTRGTHQLLNGNVGAALSLNLFVPLVLVAIAVAWWRWTATAWGREQWLPHRWAPLLARARSSPWVTWGAPAMLLVFGVVRNLPITPFRALAP